MYHRSASSGITGLPPAEAPCVGTVLGDAPSGRRHTVIQPRKLAVRGVEITPSQDGQDAGMAMTSASKPCLCIPPPPRPHGPALHGPLDLLSTAPAEQEACCNGRHRRRCGGRPEPSPRRCRRRSHPAQAGGRVERVRARGCACGPRIAPRRATGHPPPPLDCSYVIPCPLPSCITTRGNNTLWWPTCEPSLPAAAVPGALRWGWRCTGLGCCVQEEVPPW